MAFFIFLFVCNMLVPLAMIGIGFRFASHPPKKINGVYGYRTTRSMKSQEAWTFANSYCGVIWKKVGVYMAVLTAIPSILSWWMGENGQSLVSVVLVILQCIALFASIYPVEKALKENFDSLGRPVDRDQD